MELVWPKISLIIPCYNEEARLHHLHEELVHFSQSYEGDLEFILVNDGSQDGTLDMLTKMKADSPIRQKLQYLHYEQNRGKGYALREGISKSSGEYLLTLDADLSAHPDNLVTWLKKYRLSPEKIWVASREHPESQIEALEIRKWSGRLFNRWIKLITGLDIQDTQCGFKCYPNEIGKFLFKGLRHFGWSHDVEILYRAKRMGYAIEPLPVSWKHVENSKLSLLSDGIQSAWEVLKIRLKVDKEYRNMKKS